MNRIKLILAASILLLSGQVGAGLITINYEGAVQSTTGDGMGYTVGGAISGWFKFDTVYLDDYYGNGSYYNGYDGPVSSNFPVSIYPESLDEVVLGDISAGVEQILLVDASIHSCFDYTCASGNFLEEQYAYHHINLYNSAEWFDLDVLLAGGDVTFGDLPTTDNAAGQLFEYSAIQASVDSDQTSVYNEARFFVTSLQVSPVPVPAAVWLFGTGLLGLIGVRCRRKAG
jgi:hypothetical protein